MRVRRVFRAAAVGVLLMGCGKQADLQGLKLQSGSIVNGTKVTGKEFQSVVGITRQGRIICTGNLISKNEIATAAHCLEAADFSTRENILKFINKIQAYLELRYSQEQFSALSQADMDQAVKDAIKTHIVFEGLGSGIHFGNGTLGGRLAGEKLIANVIVPRGYVDYIHASLFAPKSEAARYISKNDMVILKLKQNITHIEPIPMINANEHFDNVLIGETVTAVGFGLKFDRRFIIFGAEQIQQSKNELSQTRDPQERAALEKQIEEDSALLAQIIKLVEISGDKNKVDLKLENYDHQNITLRALQSEDMQGACNGDSGGPIFVKLANGEYRQLGVMVTVDYCGRTTNAAPVFR